MVQLHGLLAFADIRVDGMDSIPFLIMLIRQCLVKGTTCICLEKSRNYILSVVLTCL